jgi:secondary thiamine-phosphate synthase enzyme
MPSSKSISRAPLSRVEASCVISTKLAVRAQGAGFIDLTPELAKFVAEAAAREGAVSLFVRHTSASLTIQENADPTVLADLGSVLQKLAPESAPWRHDTEGPDDMPAHVKTMLTATSLVIPVLDGRLALGTWQAVYLIEHRRQPHQREVILQFIGGAG